MVTQEETNQLLVSLTNISINLEFIQMCLSQVWKYDNIELNPNEKWTEIVFIYKYYGSDQIWGS